MRSLRHFQPNRLSVRLLSLEIVVNAIHRFIRKMTEVIQTVLGRVNPKDVGRTLTHEHFCLDYRKFYVTPPPEVKEYLDGDISLHNVGFVQRYPYSNKSNISFFTDDLKSAILEDLKIYKKFKGSAIVENTSHGLKRDVAFLKEVSQKTGIHVIAGTGHYLATVQSDSVLSKSVEELCDDIRTDLKDGCPELGDVKCGVIGEVASNYPIHPFERKAIQATGMVQEQLKCPVTFHPGRNSKAPSEIMRLYTEAGGSCEKAVMSHLDRTLITTEDLLNFASEYKCFLQHDLFGTEVLTYQFDPETPMPSDSQRIDRIKIFIQNGYSERILISQDIHTKHRLIHYGGHGFCHVFGNIIPKMRSCGISDSTIDQITIDNPRNWLTWNPV